MDFKVFKVFNVFNVFNVFKVFKVVKDPNGNFQKTVRCHSRSA